jgi:predicted transcriptional regulator
MTALTVELSPELSKRLREEAERAGQPVEALVETWLLERLPSSSDERKRSRDVLRAAGLLAEPSAEMKARAAQSTATLEEVSAALSRPGGKPLSEIIIEQRGPKA